MKIDTHVHTSGASSCSSATYRQMIDAYIAQSFGGVVLTNHLQRPQYMLFGGSVEKGLDNYIREFQSAKKYGQKKGFKVFLGAEVALNLPDCAYAEYLLIGIDERFLRMHPLIFDYTLEKFYLTAHDYGALVYQTHPFRSEQGHFPHDPRFTDGLEINCHKNFTRNEEQVLALAKRYGKKVCCGSDFHYLSQAGSAGMLVPDSIDCSMSLANYLKNNDAEYFYK